MGLGGEPWRVSEVMGGDAARDKIEAPRRERQRACVGAHRQEVCEPARRGELARLGQHLQRHVRRHHPRDVRRQRGRHMPGPRRDVEHVPMRLRFDECKHALQARAVRVHRRGRVGCGVAPELEHDGAWCHRHPCQADLLRPGWRVRAPS
jgi:hypothetical protein